jgi:hypothetical protein
MRTGFQNEAASGFSRCEFLFVIALGILSTLPGCARSGKLEREILSEIRQKCGDRGSCRIQIDRAALFDWDKMYAFKYTATEQDRERVLGTKDVGYRDLERQLVFLKDGKIVHQESEPRTLNIQSRTRCYSISPMPPPSRVIRMGLRFRSIN